MNIKIIVFLYLLVGILRLLSEFFRPIPRRPLYLINRNYTSMLIGILFWPLVIIIRIRSELLIEKPKIEINKENIKKIKSTKLDKTNYKRRCPYCGYYGFLIDTGEKQIGMSLPSYGGILGVQRFKDILLICKKCGHSFTKEEAELWQKLSKESTNKIAIIQYHSKLKEMEKEMKELEDIT